VFIGQLQIRAEEANGRRYLEICGHVIDGDFSKAANKSSENISLERTIIRRHARKLANRTTAGGEVQWKYFSQPSLADY
jgi:hypothetical protein